MSTFERVTTFVSNHPRTTRGAGIVALTTTLAMMSGCAGETPADREIVKTTYMGRDLVCIGYLGKNNATNYDCDFAGFHADPNYQAPATAKGVDKDDLTEHTITYQGAELHCLTFASSAATTGMTCDYTRFYQEHPPASR